MSSSVTINDDKTYVTINDNETYDLATFIENFVIGERLPDDVRDGLNRGIHHELERAERSNDKQAFYRLVMDGWEYLAIFHVDMCQLDFSNWTAWYNDFLVEGVELVFKQRPSGLTEEQIEQLGH